MTGSTIIVSIIAVVIAAGSVATLPLVCRWLIRTMRQSWRNSQGGGCSYNPLQEMIQPQVRHVVEIKEHRQIGNGESAPPR